MTFNPCLPRLSSKARLSQGGSKALLPVKASPQAIIMSVEDAVGAPAEEVKKAAYVRRTSRAIPGGRPRGTPSRCSRPHPAWLQGATAAAAAAAAAVNQLTPASTAVNQLTPASTVVTSLQLSQKRGEVETAHSFSARPAEAGVVWLLWRLKPPMCCRHVVYCKSGLDCVLASSSFDGKHTRMEWSA